ncbi:MAG: zinc ribbon domain-containing protein [Promethearchaeota archaeon]
MAKKREIGKGPICCPFCDVEITDTTLPFCQACAVEVLYCPKCHEAISRDSEVCQHCGADVREEMIKGGE